MKHNVFTLTLLIALSSLAMKAQGQTGSTSDLTAKTVFARHVEATGGKAAYKALQSIVAEGDVAIPKAGIEGTVRVQQAKGKLLIEMKLPGIGNEQIGFDGETGWRISDMNGPEILKGSAKSQIAQEALLDPYVDADQAYDSMTYNGKQEFEGSECNVVETKAGDGKPEYHYFDATSGILIAKRMTVSSVVGSFEVTNKYSEYKEIGGVKIASKQTQAMPQGMNLVTTLKSQETNVDIDDSVFELPKEIQALLNAQKQSKTEKRESQ